MEREENQQQAEHAGAAQVLPQRPRGAAEAPGHVPGLHGLGAEAGSGGRDRVGQEGVGVPGEGEGPVCPLQQGAGREAEQEGGRRRGGFGPRSLGDWWVSSLPCVIPKTPY